MSLEKVSAKRNRVYQRAFDHDEARQLREADPKRWTYAKLAKHFGVSPTAVARVVNPQVNERMAAAVAQAIRDKREPCKGGCGTLVWRHGNQNRARSGYCPACYGLLHAAPHVRDTELRCTKCGEWKPDDDFNRAPRATRRGRRSHCRDCETAARRAHRQSTARRDGRHPSSSLTAFVNHSPAADDPATSRRQRVAGVDLSAGQGTCRPDHRSATRHHAAATPGSAPDPGVAPSFTSARPFIPPGGPRP